MNVDNYVKKANIGGKILTSARSSLYFAMRFMDIALCAFNYKTDEGNHYAGTDGNAIYFWPDFLLDAYEQDVKLVNRLYLHMTLHCIYRHVFRIEDRKRRLWDVSCDIAVESIIDNMTYPCVRMRVPGFRDGIYHELRDNCKIMTAELIYNYLSKKDLSEERLSSIEEQFRVDDHNYWYHEDKNPKSQMQNNQKWEDISNRMQTSMETVEKGAGQEDGGLYTSVEAENRKRYDYKEFLRKFAVYKEEMQVDMDSFDYNFYTYGMNMYGNIPLIEPLEAKEVKKIQDFVIVIDTSFSCSEEQVKDFLTETCQILMESESFFKKVNIRILQCDIKVEKDDIITTQAEMTDYINHLEIKGRGGTDFRPAFEYVADLISKGEFENLKGLLYFTDGRGEYPKKRTPYETAFIFLKEDYVDSDVPPWAIRLEI